MHLRIGRFRDALAALCCAFTLLACVSIDLSKIGASKPTQKMTTLRGVVASTSGNSLANVSVIAGSVSVNTDAKGHYELKTTTGLTRVRFALDGFVDGFRSPTLVKDSPTQLDVSLLPRAAALRLDAASGGMIPGKRGGVVRAPADAFVDASGKSVTGMVDVYLSVFDPSSQKERAAAPELVTEIDGDMQLLESLGMLDIQVRQNGGELDIAAGKTLELSIPVPEGSDPESAVDSWSFDETKSVWVDEGKASYDAETKTYTGKLKHLSLWNAARLIEATCICGVVQQAPKSPLAGARVEASGVSYSGASSAQTDSRGRFCVAVRKDSDVAVSAYHASTGGESKQIHSQSADTLVPPRSTDARCEDIGTWTVAKDDGSSSGEVVKCGELENPFAGSCAADLGDVFGACYKPEGDCTIKLDGTASTTTYANGCYSEGSPMGASYYSSDGTLCATAASDMTASDEMRTQYTVPDKGVFTMTIGDMGNGDVVLQCPNGKELAVTAVQRQVLEACASPQANADQGNECKIESEGLDDAGAGIPTTCTTDTDCSAADTVCCAIGSGVRFCLARATCDLIKPQM